MYINRDIIEDENGFICVGPPIAGTRIEIVDDEGNALPPRKVGEITLLAGSNTRGYWNRPEENEKLFLPNGFLRTGDLGYLDEEGRLFVVGRKKHMIIRGGQNIAPKDLEEAAEQVEGLRYTAAIGVHDERFGGAERVFLFAEVRDETLSREELARKAREITSKIKERVGFRPSKVYLVRPRVIPLTPNGKIQHVTLKQRFIAGHLEEGKDILYPVSGPSDAGEKGA
ncbi:MAG: long-chain fatty acid--CoA ligase [Deltaproteobacteria bacterium]|nr:MAG: long-chain fatty acid--CoA ligase [Deltaproteobacteria bacterium]